MVSITHFSLIVYPICKEKMNGSLNRRMPPPPPGHTGAGGMDVGLRKKILLCAALVLAAALSVLAVLHELGLLPGA